jgi:hemolysin III
MTQRLTPQADVHGLVKPLLRGWFHRIAAVAAVPAGVAIVARSSGSEARVAATIYAVSLLALFTASSSYHRFRGGERWRAFLRRLDHSSIYLLIAGSYTPVCLVVLPSSYGVPLLALLWVAAIAGVAMKLGWFDRSTKLGFALYLTMGWAAVVAAPGLARGVSGSTLAVLAIGGVIYTLGSIVLATGRPRLAPRTFGFHELWHLMVVVAATLHYVALSDVVSGAS